MPTSPMGPHHELALLFERVGRTVPEPLLRVLRNPDLVPPWFRGAAIAEPRQIVSLNEDLAARGFSGGVWPREFIAVGREPSGDIYYIDARKPGMPVYLANHELVSSDDIADGQCAEFQGESVASWLVGLDRRNAEWEIETPFAVFGAGFEELAELQENPGRHTLAALFAARAVPYCSLDAAGRQDIQSPVFSGLFSTSRAPLWFTLLDDAAQLALSQPDACLLEAAVGLLAQLADAAGTTEMPSAFAASWPTLRQQVATQALVDSPSWQMLTRIYRVPR